MVDHFATVDKSLLITQLLDLEVCLPRVVPALATLVFI